VVQHGVVLPCVAVYRRRLLTLRGFFASCSVLQCVAVCCSMLQYVAVLPCVAVCCRRLIDFALQSQHTATNCITLQRSALQCDTVCCNVLQCVAMCCSVLEHVAACHRLVSTW